MNARVELVRWETHSVPDMSGEPQDVLNQQIVDHCDLGIALFWSRVGMKTREHESGSLEEIHRLIERGCKVMVYFKSADIPQARMALGQLKRLERAKAELMKLGIVGNFDGIGDLKEQVHLHLTTSVAALLKKDRFQVGDPPQPIPAVLAKPDIRVIVRSAVSVNHDNTPNYFMSIIIQNHSTMTLYMGNIVIRLKDNRQLMVPRDAITGDWQRNRMLNPGQGFSFAVNRSVFDEAKVGLDLLDCVVVFDEIGRTYESSSEQLLAVARDMLTAT